MVPLLLLETIDNFTDLFQSISNVQTITASTNVASYNSPSLQYAQKAVNYTIVPSFNGQQLNTASSNPAASFTSLINELQAGTQCQGGALFMKPGVNGTSLAGFPACE